MHTLCFRRFRINLTICYGASFDILKYNAITMKPGQYGWPLRLFIARFILPSLTPTHSFNLYSETPFCGHRLYCVHETSATTSELPIL